MKNSYSQHPGAIANRLRRLTDDQYSEKEIIRKRKQYGETRTRQIVKTAFLFLPRVEIQLERVKFHLSKGRTAADIVTRERWPMSRVVECIAQIEK
jgi:hypothetical protein